MGDWNSNYLNISSRQQSFHHHYTRIYRESQSKEFYIHSPLEVNISKRWQFVIASLPVSKIPYMKPLQHSIKQAHLNWKTIYFVVLQWIIQCLVRRGAGALGVKPELTVITKAKDLCCYALIVTENPPNGGHGGTIECEKSDRWQEMFWKSKRNNEQIVS